MNGVEITQTALLLVIAGALLWAVNLVRSELKRASAALDAALRGQKEIQEGMADLRKRVEELERKDQARQIGWLKREGEAEQPDDDGCGFSHAMPPIGGRSEDEGE